MNFNFKIEKIAGLLILESIFLFITYSHAIAESSSLNLKLPFSNGEKWIVMQGYNGSYSHSKGETIYSIDFSMSGALGKPILAVAGGKAYVKENSRINPITKEKEYYDYGKYIDIDHGEYVSRYAHLLDFAVKNGQEVKQGEIIGHCDSTGNSSGSHLHFAFFKKENGKLIPVKPEPISRYTDFEDKIALGKSYTSDNKVVENNTTKEAILGNKIKNEVIKEKPLKPKVLTATSTAPKLKEVIKDNTKEKELTATTTAPVLEKLTQNKTKSNFLFVSSPAVVPPEANTEATSTATSSPAFMATATTTPETAEENASATSTATTTPKISPDVEIKLNEDYAIDSWQYNISWQSKDEELDHYQLQKKEDNGEWQNLLSSTKGEKTIFQINKDFITYSFRVKAFTKDNRKSEWQEISAPFASRPIIINEVMYNPDPGSDDYYEYIELYNLSAIDIDLTKWKLKVGDTSEELATGTSAIIKAGGFAVIGDKPSKSDNKNIYDGYYPSLECNAEKICIQIDDASFGKAGLKNSGETIVLLNEKDKIIDKISYLGTANDKGKSLQKINPYSLSSHQNNFTLASSTPNQQNLNFNLSASTYVSDNYIISKNTIFSKKASPYLLFSDQFNSPTLNASTTLLIEPGVILKPQNTSGTGLIINGTLIAKGTENEPIKFTSPKENPAPGDYNQAIFFTEQSKGSILDYVIFEYGDFMAIPDPEPPIPLPMVSIFETKVEISNSIFRHSLYSALSLIDSDSEIENSVFENNEDTALSIQGGNSKIKNCKFSENRNPVLMEVNSQMIFSNNQLNNNSLNGILILYPELKQGATTLQAFDYPYILEDPIIVPEESTLILNPGVIIKALGNFSVFEVNGTLIAKGTEENPIVITSLYDDQYGGNTDNDEEEETEPEKNDWQSIIINNKADLSWLKLRYGGEEPLVIGEGAEVFQENISIEP